MAYSTFIDLLEAAEASGSLGIAALERESYESEKSSEDLREQAAESLGVMRAAIERGLAGDTTSSTGCVGGDGSRVVEFPSPVVSPLFSQALGYALATAEVNASMGRIVAAPTGGASGVLPGVLFALAEAHDIPVDEPADVLIDALFCAGGIGSVIAAKATLSGAAGGCQAEIGSASAMAAAAGVQLLGGSPETSGHAASLALQGQLGLVCDPVCGLVEIPCVVRNATGASVALAAIEMAMAGVTFPIPFDEVVDAMSSVGRSLPPTLRETAHGGLAITQTGKELCSRCSDCRP